MWYRHGWDSGGDWVMLTSMVVLAVAVVIAIVVAIVLIVRSAGGDHPNQQVGPSERRETPGEILRRRYAAGEIDREEYLQRLRDLEL